MTSPLPTTKTQPTKLRDSCNSCAVSKLKCSKDKPVCARCAKRDLRCEYFATRRAGRKQESRQSPQDNNNNNNNNHNNSSSTSSNSKNTNKEDDSSDARSSVHVAISATSDATNRFTPSCDVADVHMTEDMTYPSPSHPLSAEAPALLTGSDSAPWRLLSATIPGSNDLFASFPLSDVPDQLFNPAVGDGHKSMFNREDGGFDFGNFTGFPALGDDRTLVWNEVEFDAVDQFSLSTAWDSPSSPSLSSLSSQPSSTSSLTALPTVLSATSTITQRTSPASNSPPASHNFAAAPPAAVAAASTGAGCCLVRALKLLTDLFPSSAASCPCQLSSSSSSGAAESHLATKPNPTGNNNNHHHHNTSQDSAPTIQRVVTRNKQTLEAVQAMLACPCSGPDNSYLLAVISLVVLKVLGWYKATVKDLPLATAAAAATAADDTPSSMWQQQQQQQHQAQDEPGNRDCSSSSSKTHPAAACHAERVRVVLETQTQTVIDGYRLDGDERARMTAQLVLSELHRVQRLVNLLGSRLQQDAGNAGSSSSSGGGGGGGWRFAAPSFFSPAWFGQLETDLRKRVKELSLEIVDMLRQ
ncbi:hypothetical protein N657DRAFT_650709 [Parathielavia appendiculata]|uniref:Zn(2)-C6 fungal-type domain-containing protein n=1 Tax=Parathielavia appendiculata TaxID=2587402 RepID=A0AAN6TRL7_9PEZI|nr:hypothetical protein N657DRAFT_650709 [Parathielavia appendiculata]